MLKKPTQADLPNSAGKDPRHRIPLRRVAAAGGVAEKELQRLLKQLHLAAMKMDA